jgi:hypothetical protein
VGCIFDDCFAFVLLFQSDLFTVMVVKLLGVQKAFETCVTEMPDSTKRLDVIDYIVVVVVQEQPMFLSVSVFAPVCKSIPDIDSRTNNWDAFPCP